MYKTVSLLLLVLMSLSQSVYSKEKPLNLSSAFPQYFEDQNFNQVLWKINRFGKNHLGDFIKSVSKHYTFKKDTLIAYLTEKQLEAAEISLAIGLAHIKKTSPEVILRRYLSHKAMGWEMMGKMMGVTKKSQHYQSWLNAQMTLLKHLENDLLKKRKAESKKEKKPKSQNTTK